MLVVLSPLAYQSICSFLYSPRRTLLKEQSSFVKCHCNPLHNIPYCRLRNQPDFETVNSFNGQLIIPSILLMVDKKARLTLTKQKFKKRKLMPLRYWRFYIVFTMRSAHFANLKLDSRLLLYETIDKCSQSLYPVLCWLATMPNWRNSSAWLK